MRMMLGVGSLIAAMEAADMVEAIPPERRREPIKIPRSLYYKPSWEDMHPNDDWRGRGNKKRKVK